MGDIGDLVKKARKSSAKALPEEPKHRKQALQKYLRENPDIKHKMAAAKKQVGLISWMEGAAVVRGGRGESGRGMLIVCCLRKFVWQD